MLSKKGILSQDVQKRIFRKVFPSQEMLEDWLDENVVSMRDCPDLWSEAEIYHMILAGQGGFQDDEFGVPPEDAAWLMKVADALGLKYKSLGR